MGRVGYFPDRGRRKTRKSKIENARTDLKKGDRKASLRGKRGTRNSNLQEEKARPNGDADENSKYAMSDCSDEEEDARAKEGQKLALSANDHWNRYHELGDAEDLLTAIRLDRICLQELCELSDPSAVEVMGNLGLSLLDLFNRNGDPDVLDEAHGYLERCVSLMRSSTPVSPPPSYESSTPSSSPIPTIDPPNLHPRRDHPSLTRAKINYANALRARATLHGSSAAADLNNAIELLEEAVQETPSTHASWDVELRHNCLARALIERGLPLDLERAMKLMMRSRQVRFDEGGSSDSRISNEDTKIVSTEKEPLPSGPDNGVLLCGFGPGALVSDLTPFVKKCAQYPSGCGGFADIFMGEWRKTARLRQKVAIKVVRHMTFDTTETERMKRLLEAELSVWRELNHVNVVRLLGTSNAFGPYKSMICPWFANGSLQSFLRKHSSLVYSERLRLIKGIASGLYYLHSHAIIHGDLTGANILIDDNQNACLSDFGLSVLARDFKVNSVLSRGSSMNGAGGAVRWAAPELFSFGEQTATDTDDATPSVTFYTDVYSFGSVALETFTGEQPYHYVQNDMEVLLKYVVQLITPRQPASHIVRDEHWEVLQSCWARRPSDRPNSKVLPSMFSDAE